MMSVRRTFLVVGSQNVSVIYEGNTSARTCLAICPVLFLFSSVLTTPGNVVVKNGNPFPICDELT
jgi:hypothetical protein